MKYRRGLSTEEWQGEFDDHFNMVQTYLWISRAWRCIKLLEFIKIMAIMYTINPGTFASTGKCFKYHLLSIYELIYIILI
jgi:hypothetical protein